MKSSAVPQMKLNPPTAAAISLEQSKNSHCEAIFHPPERVDLVEKPTCRNKPVFLSMGYEKDIFAVFAYELGLLPFLSYHNSLFKSMLCEAKLPFLLSLLSYLFSGNDNLREERRTKREK